MGSCWNHQHVGATIMNLCRGGGCRRPRRHAVYWQLATINKCHRWGETCGLRGRTREGGVKADGWGRGADTGWATRDRRVSCALVITNASQPTSYPGCDHVLSGWPPHPLLVDFYLPLPSPSPMWRGRTKKGRKESKKTWDKWWIVIVFEFLLTHWWAQGGVRWHVENWR